MIISLAASLSVDKDLEGNLSRLEKVVAGASEQSSDLLLFGEAFLQGFDAITFNYKHDINNVALGVHSYVIAKICQLSRRFNIAIGFGFYENDHSGIYNSYMIVGSDGKIIVKYQRISPGAWVADANVEYRLGRELSIFEFKGKYFAILLCGDFWEDYLLEEIIELDTRVDAFLWPVHCDYTVEQWSQRAHKIYRERSQILANPIFFVNNFRLEKHGAKGGAYVWRQGRELAALEVGSEGYLSYEFQ